MIDALKRSVATFIFSTTGVLIGANLLNIGAETWELAASTGLGSLINLAYRSAERWLKDHPEDGGFLRLWRG